MTNSTGNDRKPEDEAIDVFALGTPEVTEAPPTQRHETTPGQVEAVSVDGINKLQTRRERKKHRKNTSYWGLTPIFVSFLLYLILQLASGVIMSITLVFQHAEEIMAAPEDADKIIYAALAEKPLYIVIMQVLMYVLWVGSAMWVARFRSDVPEKRSFWTAFKENFYLTEFKKRDILYGVGAAVGFFGVLTGLTSLFEWLGTIYPNVFNMEGAGNTAMFSSLSGVWFIVISFGIGGLLGPIVEEVFFRGFVTRGLVNHFTLNLKNSKDYRAMDDFESQSLAQLPFLGAAVNAYRLWVDKHKVVLAVVLSSVLFGFMHFQGSATFGQWFVVLVTGSLGGLMGFMTQKTGRLYPAIIAHVLYNTGNFVLLALSLTS